MESRSKGLLALLLSKSSRILYATVKKMAGEKKVPAPLRYGTDSTVRIVLYSYFFNIFR